MDHNNSSEGHFIVADILNNEEQPDPVRLLSPGYGQLGLSCKMKFWYSFQETESSFGLSIIQDNQKIKVINLPVSDDLWIVHEESIAVSGLFNVSRKD